MATKTKARQATEEEVHGETNEDVVVVASVRKDGTPDQSPGFKFIDADLGEAMLEAQQKTLEDTGVDHVAILKNERAAVGTDPRVAELEAEVRSLRAQLREAKKGT